MKFNVDDLIEQGLVKKKTYTSGEFEGLSVLKYSKKAIMRLGQAKVDDMFDNPEKFKQRIDEEFYGITDFIVKTVNKEQWKSYNDQQRRAFIEKYFEENNK